MSQAVSQLSNAVHPQAGSGRWKLGIVLLCLIPIALLLAIEVPTLVAEQSTETKRREIARAGGKCSLERRSPQWVQSLMGPDFHSFLDRTVIAGVTMNGTSIDDSDVKALIGLLDIETLELEDSRISEAALQSIVQLPSLKTLNLSSTPIQAIDQLHSLPRLEHLNISYSKVRDGQLAPLAEFKALRRANLAGLQMTDAGVPALGQCVNLEELNISGAALGPKGLEPLHALKGLKQLILRSSQVAPEDLRQFSTAVPDCKVLM